VKAPAGEEGELGSEAAERHELDGRVDRLEVADAALERRFLGAEVLVERARAGRQAGGLLDLTDGGAANASIGEQAQPRRDDPLAGAGAVPNSR
jgi:hypothetical protein